MWRSRDLYAHLILLQTQAANQKVAAESNQNMKLLRFVTRQDSQCPKLFSVLNFTWVAKRLSKFIPMSEQRIGVAISEGVRQVHGLGE